MCVCNAYCAYIRCAAILLKASSAPAGMVDYPKWAPLNCSSHPVFRSWSGFSGLGIGKSELNFCWFLLVANWRYTLKFGDWTNCLDSADYLPGQSLQPGRSVLKTFGDHKEFPLSVDKRRQQKMQKMLNKPFPAEDCWVGRWPKKIPSETCLCGALADDKFGESQVSHKWTTSIGDTVQAHLKGRPYIAWANRATSSNIQLLSISSAAYGCSYSM